MVLWASVLLAVVAASVLKTSRTDLELSRNLIDATHAELAADSALWTAVHQVLTEEDTPWQTDGSVYGWRIDGVEVRVRITDEIGRIDLNAASGELLARLFEAAGETAGQAQTLSDTVVEFRNSTALSFMSTESLEQVPGMPVPLVARIAEAVTVFTGEPEPEGIVAEGLALAAIDDAFPAEKSERRYAPPVSNGDAPEILVASDNEGFAVSNLLRIQAEALMPGGSHFARDALVETPRGRSPDVRIRQWRRGIRTLIPRDPL
jgi:general secretion pathway protein K